VPRWSKLSGKEKLKLFDARRNIKYTPSVALVSGISIVTRMGIVLYPPLLYQASVYRQTPMVVKAIVYGLASLLKRKLVYISQKCYFGLIHSSWTLGYYHWLTEALPRAYLLKKSYPDAIPLLPGEYKKYEDSLSALGFDEVCYYPNGSNIIVDNLVHTGNPPVHAYICPRLLIDVSRAIKSYYGLALEGKAFRLVYLSRQRARGRKVMNETEVIDLVHSLGGEVLHAEELTFAEQVSLMAETALLVSIHGAGLTNSIFMPRGSSVIEILPYKNGIADYNWTRFSVKHEICYQLLADTFGLGYSFLECSHNAGPCESTHMADIDVDTKELESLIRCSFRTN
jgi:hypothetical protein